VIGGTAALMIGGGIGVAAHAAPGDVRTVGGTGDTEEQALEAAKHNCALLPGDFQEQAGFPIRVNVLPSGTKIQVKVTCLEKSPPPGDLGHP
jgi:hypothetical protein